MALSFNIQYDPKKYEPIVQGLRDIYKYAPDPAGFEASYMTANIIAESFPTSTRNRRSTTRRNLLKPIPDIN